MIKRLVKALIRRLIWGVCFFFPIKKNRIVFSSYYGRGYGDNLKYICDKLTNAGFDIIWLVKTTDEARFLPDNVKPVKTGLRSVYYLTTANVWINNCRSGFLFKKKKQFYIQTWHGGGGQKRCELDVVDKLEHSYVKMAKRDAQMTDLMVSESRFMTDLYYNSFWYNGPVYECGYPRYDILLNEDKKIVQKVYDYFNIEKAKKIVLYAPTFRADNSFDAYNIDFNRLIVNLKKKFNEDYVVLVHLHPNVANIDGKFIYDGQSVINSTFYPDTQELLVAASILVGDYSSINYDFSLKRLPVFRYAADLDEYQQDRDFYYSFEEYPYPYAKNNDELEKLILNFDNEKYLVDLNEFFKKIGAVFCANSAQKIADIIKDYIKAENKKLFFKNNKYKFIHKKEVEK